ncbi:MAG: 50S ribosomal protein L11 methyltransferase [Limnochordia bacterium]|jgi:ribosomal protein L11 methyltransferase
MEWTKIHIQVDPAGREAVSHILIEAGSPGVEVTPTGVIGYFPAGRDCLEIEEGLRIVEDWAGPISCQKERVTEEDWAHGWKKYYKPLPVGERLLICPSWEEADAGRQVVYLDPGMAFGTGDHPTTFACLLELDRLVNPGMVVYDVGCGSGILALAAARLGAARVFAVDNDPLAVDVCRRNIALNGLEDVVTVAHGSIEELPADPADIILMNILPHVIIELAPAVKEQLKEGGSLITAGINVVKGDKTKAALQGAGFQILREQTIGEWVSFTLGRC